MGENEGAGSPSDDEKRPLSGHAIDLGRNHSMQKEQQEPMLRKEVGQSKQQKEKPRKLDQCQRDKLLPDRDEGVGWGQIIEGLVGHGKWFGSH